MQMQTVQEMQTRLRTVKQQARTEAAHRRQHEESPLSREMTEGEVEGMLMEIEVHEITFARSRYHMGNEGVADKDAGSRCRCRGCAKPAPAREGDAPGITKKAQLMRAAGHGPAPCALVRLGPVSPLA